MKDATVTFVVPTYNEEENITRCLNSIFSQDYPKSKLQVILVDDNSEDNTVRLAKKFPVKVLKHCSRHAEIGKKIGFDYSIGKYFIFLDADIHLRGKDWIRSMVRPLQEDDNIAASFTRYLDDRHSTLIERYLNIDEFQRDPVYRYFSIGLEGVNYKKKKGYLLCEFCKNKIPPAGFSVQRKKLLDEIVTGDMYLELEVVANLVEKGWTKFAYVPDAGVFHHHAKDIFELMRKRFYNTRNVYLKTLDLYKRKYTWFDVKSTKGILKIIYWIIVVHLFFPLFIQGIYLSKKTKKIIALLEPIVAIILTDTIIFAFVFSKKSWIYIFSKVFHYYGRNKDR